MAVGKQRDVFFEDIGSRLELMVDDHLIEQITGEARLLIHKPVACEVALSTDRAWEGDACNFGTVLMDGGQYRMYYRGCDVDAVRAAPVGTCPVTIACAESEDGIVWRRPELGLFEFQGSLKNNIVFRGYDPDKRGITGFAPFIDTNPACSAERRYKAVGSPHVKQMTGLFAMHSADGYQWALTQEAPILADGVFDSQNLVFWDVVRGEYRAYFRDYWKGESRRYRDIRTCTSKDFVNWSEPEWLNYPGTPAQELYTNQVIPYYRAPHLFLGFPTRYLDRGWSPSMEGLSELEHRRIRAEKIEARTGTGLTDGLFMSSRDGKTFRVSDEAFLRPGPQRKGNWTYGDNFQFWGMVPTRSGLEDAPDELSIYATENYWRKPTRFRRYRLRMDGFGSVHAGWRGGGFVTKAVKFSGEELWLNFATSAAGGIGVELQDAQGTAIEGYAMGQTPEVFGDAISQRVVWNGGRSLEALKGQTLRIRFELRDADLYAFRFGKK
jgi:hypothetical protein